MGEGKRKRGRVSEKRQRGRVDGKGYGFKLPDLQEDAIIKY